VLALIAVSGAPGAPASSDSIPASGAARAETVTLAPFAAHFTADWKSINVGTSDIELTADSAPGRYVYTWTTMGRGVFRLAFDDVAQKSWISVLAGRVRPEKYFAKQGNSTRTIDFDWNDGHARGLADGKFIDLKLDSGIQDVMSIQIQVMLDVAGGRLPATFKILDNDEIKDFIYTLEGPARIRTALGELDTLVVADRRAGSNRVLKMWFAPALGFVPVQAERLRDGKLEFALRIKTLKR
jgi:hypothetical protein